jgi:hypothetical protein
MAKILEGDAGAQTRAAEPLADDPPRTALYYAINRGVGNRSAMRCAGRPKALRLVQRPGPSSLSATEDAHHR